MYKKALPILLTALLALGAAGVSNAQYVGPDKSSAYKNVAAVLKNPVDDAYVTLQGKLISRVGHEKYQFSDGSGTITVEIDDKYFAGQRVDENTRVEIWGEIEKDLMKAPEIDVKRITVIR